MKTYKNYNSLVKIQVFETINKEKAILEYIKKSKATCLYREGNFANEIIWNGTAYKFTKQEKGHSFRKGLFLFSLVRKDAKEWLKKNKVKMPRKYPVNFNNISYDFKDDKVVAFDIDHAYWRIAYNLGIIKYNTYFYGLDNDYKALRLACLSTMGKQRDYLQVVNGVVTNRVAIIEGNEDLANLYKVIRYTCYRYMHQLRKLLGNDFMSYNTDCIYFRDTKENREKVKEFLKKKDLEFKLLYQRKSVPTQERPLKKPN